MFVLDTSAVINLLGTAAAPRLLRGLTHPCLLEERVISELRYHPIPGNDLTAELDQLATQGLLTRVRMSETAYALFVQLAAVSGVGGLGIGESAAIAVAQEFGVAVVLDDRKARKRAEADFPTLALSSSTRLFLESAKRAKMSDDDLRKAFKSAQANACMGVLKDERQLVTHLNIFE